MQNRSKDSSPFSQSPSESPSLESAFSEAFLANLGSLSRAGLRSAVESEALLSGPFAVEPMDRPDGARFAVVRPDEPVSEGGKACAVYRERDEALRLAAVLPAIASPRLYHLGSRPKAHGCYTLHRSRRFVGHVSQGVERLSSERRRTLLTHLDLARYLASHPQALALILESVGPEALPILGRALARRIKAALPRP